MEPSVKPVIEETEEEVAEFVAVPTMYGTCMLPKYIADAGFKSDHIPKTDLIKVRGWTAKLIEMHLGAADKIVKNSYKRGTYCSLFEVKRVFVAEQSSDVKEAISKIAKSRVVRRAAGKKTAIIRKVKTDGERADRVKEMVDYVQKNKTFFSNRLREIAKSRKPGLPVGKRTLKNDDHVLQAMFDICKDFGFDISKQVEIAVNNMCNEVADEFRPTGAITRGT